MHKVLSSLSPAQIHQEEIGSVCSYFQDSFHQIFYPKCCPCMLSVSEHLSLTCISSPLKEESVLSIFLAWFQLQHGPLCALPCSSLFVLTFWLFLVHTYSSTKNIPCMFSDPRENFRIQRSCGLVLWAFAG